MACFSAILRDMTRTRTRDCRQSSGRLDGSELTQFTEFVIISPLLRVAEWERNASAIARRLFNPYHLILIDPSALCPRNVETAAEEEGQRSSRGPSPLQTRWRKMRGKRFRSSRPSAATLVPPGWKRSQRGGRTQNRLRGNLCAILWHPRGRGGGASEHSKGECFYVRPAPGHSASDSLHDG